LCKVCENEYAYHVECKENNKHIVGIVVRDLCPAAMVEGVGFQALMNSGYHVPSATHIGEVVRRKFTNEKTAIKSYLQTEADQSG